MGEIICFVETVNIFLNIRLVTEEKKRGFFVSLFFSSDIVLIELCLSGQRFII